MRAAPSAELTATLHRLELAGPKEFARVRRKVAALAGPLPLCDSIWLEALRQGGVISAYQLRQLQAGRATELHVAGRAITGRLGQWNGLQVYQTRRHAEIKAQANKSYGAILLVADIASADVTRIPGQLSQLSEKCLNSMDLVEFAQTDFGLEESRLWIELRQPRGACLAELLREHGRMPPWIAWQVFRQLVQQLAAWESLAILHGDIHVRNCWLTSTGQAALHRGGIRPIWDAIRAPNGLDSATHAHLISVEDIESLAPERIREGATPDTATELFALGALGWHLLTGRPAVAGATTPAKQQRLRSWQPISVRQLAPDAPPLMIELVDKCLANQPENRPASFAAMLEVVGMPDRDARQQVGRYLRTADRWLLPRPRVRRGTSIWKTYAAEALALSACVLVVLAGWRWLVAPAVQRPAGVMTAAIAQPISPSTETTPGTPASPESGVQLAKYTVANEKLNPPTAATRNELRLPTGEISPLAQIEFQPRQVVTCQSAAQGACAVVQVPRGGLVVNAPDVTFRNLVFLPSRRSRTQAAAGDIAAYAPLVRLRAPAARFENCLFLNESDTPVGAAVMWEPDALGHSDLDPVGDRIVLSACACSGVAALLDRRRVGDAKISLRDSLLMNVERGIVLPYPLRGQACNVQLTAVTQRGGGPLLSLLEIPEASAAGKMSVVAEDSLFAPQSQAALIELSLQTTSELPVVQWRGHGSMISPDTPLVLLAPSQTVDGDDLAEQTNRRVTEMNVSGLARASFTFANASLHDPSASAVRQIVGPRKSLVPPGVAPAVLHEFSAWCEQARQLQGPANH